MKAQKLSSLSKSVCECISVFTPPKTILFSLCLRVPREKRQSVHTLTSSSSKQPGKDLLTPPPLVLSLSYSFPTHIFHFLLSPHRRCRGPARSPSRPALSGPKVPGQLGTSACPRPFSLLLPPLPPEIPSPPLRQRTPSGAAPSSRSSRAPELLRPRRTGRARRRRGPGLGPGLGPPGGTGSSQREGEATARGDTIGCLPGAAAEPSACACRTPWPARSRI